MVDRLLDSLLALTLAFSAASLLVMLLREPCRKLFGSAFTYWLWLLVPLALAAALAPALPHPVAPAVPVQTVSQLVMAPVAAMQPHAPTLVESALAVLRGLSPYLLGAWGFGLLAFLCRIALLQRRFVEGLGRLTRDPGRPNVFYSEKSGVSPSVVGLLRSRIVLPADFGRRYAAEEQTLIMAHERTHVRERHPTAGALGVLIVAAQWFNPLGYLALTLFRIDQELACDAAVVTAHPTSRAAYAKAMLKARIGVDLNPPLAYCWISRLSLPMKDRISLLRSPPPSPGQRAAAVALLTLIASFSAVAAYAIVPHPRFGISLGQPVASAPSSPIPERGAAPQVEAKPLAAPTTKASGAAAPVEASSAPAGREASSVSVVPALLANSPISANSPSSTDDVTNQPRVSDLDEGRRKLYDAMAEAAARGENVAPPELQWVTRGGQTYASVLTSPSMRDPTNFDDLLRIAASIS